TATHLLQNALRQVLGEHVKQAGSLVASDRLRFDFTHFTAMAPREIERVEEIVNRRIRENASLEVYELPFEEARKRDIIAIFGEKYGDRVRVVDIGSYSRELCGGTHVKAAGDIGVFVIAGEGSVAAGVRRIEAMSGEAAFKYLKKRDAQVRELAGVLKVEPDALLDRVEAMRKEHKSMKKTAGREHARDAIGDIAGLIAQARTIQGIAVLATELPGLSVDSLRDAGDRIRGAMKSGVCVLGSRVEGRAQLICMVTDDLVKKGLHAGKIIGTVAGVIGGRGGGRPQMAQAGGSQPERLPEALAGVADLVAALSRPHG
ncbi:MAG: DHHA1 domain-containing protein, partial [Candidatus Aureabacteria bacterium]|nr:DHHA1 domain-containing protein [Candidatus Auribacterota bacterium]